MKTTNMNTDSAVYLTSSYPSYNVSHKTNTNRPTSF